MSNGSDGWWIWYSIKVHVNVLVIPSDSKHLDCAWDKREKDSDGDDDYVDVDDKDNNNNNHDNDDDDDNDFVAIPKIFTAIKQLWILGLYKQK